MKRLLIILQMLTVAAVGQTNDSLNIDASLLMDAYTIYIDSVANTLKCETGTVTLKNNIATINVPEGYKYLDGKSSDMILTDIWGNPPREASDRSLGMLLKENETPFYDSSFCINITYAEEGFIDDEDAKDMDYEELLETMQEDTETSNKYRLGNGYERIELVGWASEPFYDEQNKKLHWAKELKFGKYEGGNTLNYNIRILGKKGYLQLNAIGEMYVLQSVKKALTQF